MHPNTILSYWMITELWQDVKERKNSMQNGETLLERFSVLHTILSPCNPFHLLLSYYGGDIGKAIIYEQREFGTELLADRLELAAINYTWHHCYHRLVFICGRAFACKISSCRWSKDESGCLISDRRQCDFLDALHTSG